MEFGESNRWLDHVSGEITELFKAIDEGEHQKQDFKFRIDSAQKIAVTLVSFANTDGGKLLIGVKDNGRITGVDPEEEFYMIEGAATLYCQPVVHFKTMVYENEEGKKVLEVEVPASQDSPHSAKTESGQWKVFIRQGDENFAANGVIVDYLKNKQPVSKRKNMVAYGPEERALFELLSRTRETSISRFKKEAGIEDIRVAERILVLFLQWKIIGYRATEKGIRFYLLS